MKERATTQESQGVSLSTNSNEGGSWGRAAEEEEILAGLRLWRDSCFSLAELAASHRGAAGAMLEACGGGLVASLAGAHDELLPAVEAAFRRGALSSSPPSEPAATATEKVSENLFFLSLKKLLLRHASQPATALDYPSHRAFAFTSKIKTTNGHERSFSTCDSRDYAVRYPSTLRLRENK